MLEGIKIFIIGLVGKIASGKSTVSKYLKRKLRNSLVLDVDKIAKGIYSNDGEVLKNLENCFGSSIFSPVGKVDFNVLAKRVFSSSIELEKLNKIMFPKVRREVRKIINNSFGKNYIIIDAAVLFDSRLDLLCDYIILVKADKSLRKKLLKNKGTEISDKDIDLRLDGQRIKINKNLVNFTVINNSSKADLYKKVEDILEKINDCRI